MRSAKIRTFSANEKLVEERRRKIIHCARLLFVKKGYDRTSMRDIGKACGMTSAGMYHYLGQKDDILSIVVQKEYSMIYAFIRETEEDTEKYSPVEALTRAIERYYRLGDEHREDASFISNNHTLFKPGLRLQILETLTNVIAVFEKILIKGCKTADFKIDNCWLMAFNILGSGQLWFLRHEALVRKCSIDTYIKFQTDLVLNQICTPKARAEVETLSSR